MKRKTISVLIAIALLAASFFLGAYVKEREHIENRQQRCRTLVSFAMDKAENGDLSVPGTMNALISNVYAAYEFCDDPISARQLHGLWNYLLTTTDDEDAVKFIVVKELKGVLKWT